LRWCPKSQKNTSYLSPRTVQTVRELFGSISFCYNKYMNPVYRADWKQKFSGVETKYKKSKSPGQFKIKNIYLFPGERREFWMHKQTSRKTPTESQKLLSNYLCYSPFPLFHSFLYGLFVRVYILIHYERRLNILPNGMQSIWNFFLQYILNITIFSEHFQ